MLRPRPDSNSSWTGQCFWDTSEARDDLHHLRSISTAQGIGISGRENPGTSYAGTVLQHLVGAKLELALPRKAVRHHGASVADAAGERAGDFEIDDVVVHVTLAAGEALIRKCLENLESGRRPIVVTSREGFEDEYRCPPVSVFSAGAPAFRGAPHRGSL